MNNILLKLFLVFALSSIYCVGKAQWKLVEYFPSYIDTIYWEETLNLKNYEEHNVNLNKRINEYTIPITLKSSSELDLLENLFFSAENINSNISKIFFLIAEKYVDSLVLDSTNYTMPYQTVTEKKIRIPNNCSKFHNINLKIQLVTKDDYQLIEIKNIVFYQKIRLECNPPYLGSILNNIDSTKKYNFPPDMVFINPDLKSDDETELLISLTLIAIENYSFYRINNLIKDSVLTSFKQFIQNYDKSNSL